jgi:predicted ArsR family transcriptional regulator
MLPDFVLSLMSDDRERNAEGRYVPTVTPERVLDVLRDAEDPVLTAKEVGDTLGYTSEAARQRLHELRERGDVETKQVGARAVVWWPV